MPQQLKSHLKAAEGTYQLVTDRPTSCSFNPTRGTRVTYAELSDGPEQGEYVIFNAGESLHICRYGQANRAPLRTIPSGASTVSPTCHSFCKAVDGLDLLCGVSSGDVLLTSLRGQLAGSGASPRSASMHEYNTNGCIDNSRCVAVSWLNGGAAAFISAHLSGYVYVFHKVLHEPKEGSRNSTPKAAAQQPALAIHATSSALTDAVPSPDGTRLASTARDGTLRLHDLNSGVLLAGFKSYYGSLLCCCWTHDSRYVATGGEDDLVSVYGVAERCIVSWGSGHLSWVSRVSFDPWLCQRTDADSRAQFRTLSGNARTAPDVVYRLGSVGMDCQLFLWDVTIPSDGSSSYLRDEARKATPAQDPPLGLQSSIAPAACHLDMVFVPPVTQCKSHMEPLTEIVFTPLAIFTACHGGSIKAWQRPASNSESINSSSITRGSQARYTDAK